MSARDVAVSGCDSGGLLKARNVVLGHDVRIARRYAEQAQLVSCLCEASADLQAVRELALAFRQLMKERAVAAFPGVTIVTSHDWFGCPFVPPECGSPANAVLPSTQHKAPLLVWLLVLVSLQI